jgi:hypothetical protein
MTSDSKRPSIAFWATVVMIAVLAYPLSFGPACWITSRLNRGAELVPVLYRPLTWAMSEKSDATFNRVSRWYAKVGAPDVWEWGCAWDPATNRPAGWVWVSLENPTSDIW